MTDAALVRLGRAIALLGIAAAVTVMAAHAALGVADVTFDSFNLHTALFSTVLGIIGFAAVGRQPRNLAVWVTLVAILFAAIELASWTVGAAWSVTARGADFYRSLLEGGSPADLPDPVAWVFWLAWWTWLPAFVGFITMGLLWFPTGRLPGPGWRWAAALAGVGLSLTVAGHAIAFRPGSTLPYETTSEYPGIGGLLIGIGFPVLAAAGLATVASLVVRYRSGDVVVRQQLRWIGLGAAAIGVSFGVLVFVKPTALAAVTLVTLPMFLGGYGVAILRYRLYEVDVVISKGVTYAALAGFITLVYVAVVVGVGAWLEAGDEPNLVLAVAATAIVAVLFEPLRRWLQRLANRMVYGRRASRLEVLSQTAARLGGAREPQAALDRLAELVAAGTGAERAVVWLAVGDELRPQAGAGGDFGPVGLAGELSDLGMDHVAAVRHGDELLGAVGITKARGDSVSPTDEQLLADVAAGAALLMRNTRLNAQLAQRAEELRASRRRLVTAQDAERRRLERDLHDGAQQQVVALKVKLGLARTVAAKEGTAEVAELLGGLADDAQESVDAMRAVARGIYPPLLESEGLGAALAAVQRTAAVPMDVDVAGIGRYPRHVEETVYFCVREVADRAYDAGAHGMRVALAEDDGDLVLTIDHDGRASEADYAAVADRVDAFGGETSVGLLNGAGARVAGRLPVEAP